MFKIKKSINIWRKQNICKKKKKSISVGGSMKEKVQSEILVNRRVTVVSNKRNRISYKIN